MAQTHRHRHTVLSIAQRHPKLFQALHHAVTERKAQPLPGAMPSPAHVAVAELAQSIERLAHARRASHRLTWWWGFACGFFWCAVLAALAVLR